MNKKNELISYKFLPYRKCAGIMLINDKNKVFVAKRIDTKVEAWQMPQGGIDKGEYPKDAALRELEEEVGTNKAEIISESNDWYKYDIPENLIGQLWGGKYRGQSQKWFLMKFTGNDEDININTPNPEFSEWKWENPSLLPDIIVDFKKKLYKQVLEEFSDKIFL